MDNDGGHNDYVIMRENRERRERIRREKPNFIKVFYNENKDTINTFFIL